MSLRAYWLKQVFARRAELRARPKLSTVHARCLGYTIGGLPFSVPSMRLCALKDQMTKVDHRPEFRPTMVESRDFNCIDCITIVLEQQPRYRS